METSANGIYYADETMGHPDLTNVAGALVTLLDELLGLAGFSIIYTGTNKRVYQSDDVESSQLFCRVDDTYGSYARLRGYETMSDVDTGTGLFPLDSQLSGGYYVYKASAASARSWRFYSNGKIFYLFIDSQANGSWPGIILFGDGNSYVENDAYNCLIAGSEASSGPTNFSTLNSINGLYVARVINQSGGSWKSYRMSHVKTFYFGYTNAQPFPRRADNKLAIWRVEYWDEDDDAHGMLPGLWNPIHSSDLPDAYEFSNIPELPGRILKVQSCGASVRQCCMDLTGPW